MKLSESIYTEAFKTYNAMGLDPLPIPYQKGHPTKGPILEGWQQKAADGEYTEEHFKESCNIGILLGGERHVTDIDCDSPEAVAVSGDIMGHVLKDVGNTMIFGRASKRRSHYVFCCDRSLPSEKITDPIDRHCIIEYRCVKQDGDRGHQTVFPPSLWYDPASGHSERVQFEPDSVEYLARVDAAKLRSRFRMIGALALLAKHFPCESERHNTILALAGVFARAGFNVKKAIDLVKLAYCHSKGFNHDATKVAADVASVYRQVESNPSAHLFGYPKLIELIPKAVVDRAFKLLGIETQQSAYNPTDAGNGRRLVDKYRDDIRYCVDDRTWYVWDRKRWHKDVVSRIRELAKGIATDIRHEAEAARSPIPTGDESRDKTAKEAFDARQRDLLRWANQSENADRVSKTIVSASSDPRITCSRSDFDAHGELLNCNNGVVNLYTGELRSHDRLLMLSQLCPVDYDPSASHPVWQASLAAFTRNHPDLLPFLRTIAGYSIQGDKSEERILILFGPGSAGKGTFMDWLTSALGPDYACAMDANSVLKQKRDSSAASGDIARLEGKRIVVVSEIEKGSRMQESFMKQASGNDTLVARSLYQSEREFRPTHQFWFQTNYRPGIDSTDSGNRRRYVEIPFDNDLKLDPHVKFDPKLKLRMRQDPKFKEAVLAWCVDGCVEWRKNGLILPKSVEIATAQFFAHNDFLKEFLSERCVADRDECVAVKAMSDSYNEWCDGQGEEPAQGRTFNRMLEERGYVRKQARVHGRSTKAWIGIRLKEHDELVGGRLSQRQRSVPAMPKLEPDEDG